ncbi:hypothetical protein [Mycobacterium haemophilum]|uniref:hypothetical protein n=1 Tax=Mycobacterium haemophilum TaxID=29311 RepID=UPI0021F26BC5|nr:hypothetical protein [Mycobacterium haemophilum]
MGVISHIDLDRVGTVYRLRSFRIASVLRIGVVAMMVAAMVIGTRRCEWPRQIVWIVLYALATLVTLLLAFARFRGPISTCPSGLVVFTVLDIVMLTGFQLLSTDGIYPLLVMTLLPILLGLDVRARRAAVLLVFALAGFAIAVLEDPDMVRVIGWPNSIFRFMVYAFLCGTAYVVVRIEDRRAHSVASLSALREELLAQTMTASEVLQRRVSGFLKLFTMDRCKTSWLCARNLSSWIPRCPAMTESAAP